MTTIHELKKFLESDGFEIEDACMSITLHVKKDGKEKWFGFKVEPLRDEPHPLWARYVADRVSFKFDQEEEEE